MLHFNRAIVTHLAAWTTSTNRKPLILQGARQVGKSSAVRQLAATHFKYFLEVNLEQEPSIGTLVTTNSPKRATELLEIQYGVKVIPGETLLFLDEIQSTPRVLGALRYFYEELPELHIIAAGSLLDFALDSAEFSMPVGRVQYAYMGPVSFPEFLGAVGEEKLLEFLRSVTLNTPELNSSSAVVPDALHQKAMQLVRTYTLVGGMPEAIATYASSRSLKIGRAHV
jgi:predicted AAA+ superfamily ATPase